MQSGYILTPLTPLHCVRSILMYNTMHFLFSFLTCTSQSYVNKEKENGPLYEMQGLRGGPAIDRRLSLEEQAPENRVPRTGV